MLLNGEEVEDTILDKTKDREVTQLNFVSKILNNDVGVFFLYISRILHLHKSQTFT